MSGAFTADPSLATWLDLMTSWRESGERLELLGESIESWRRQTRRELDLPAEEPIVATGHQPALWHPGILAKYLAVDAMRERGAVPLNIIVDQDVIAFAELDIPTRDEHGQLDSQRLALADHQAETPVGRQGSFLPCALPAHLTPALPSVEAGLARIHAALAAHRDSPSAAAQVARALHDLMQPWVKPMPRLMASDLMKTSLAAALVQQMHDDPSTCALMYNEAIEHASGAGLKALQMEGVVVELPLWEVSPNGVRVSAQTSLGGFHSDGTNLMERLLPRALFMTALLRLAVCDLFVHGTGGGIYDRAMERWIRSWLGVDVAPMAVVTADLFLPLGARDEPVIDLASAERAARRAWHDPESARDSDSSSTRPGQVKRRLLAEIEALPRVSRERRARFRALHQQLASLRTSHQHEIDATQSRLAIARRQSLERPMTQRRDWCFALYPPAMIDALAEEVRCRVREKPAIDAGSPDAMITANPAAPARR